MQELCYCLLQTFHRLVRRSELLRYSVGHFCGGPGPGLVSCKVLLSNDKLLLTLLQFCSDPLQHVAKCGRQSQSDWVVLSLLLRSDSRFVFSTGKTEDELNHEDERERNRELYRFEENLPLNGVKTVSATRCMIFRILCPLERTLYLYRSGTLF